MSQHRSLTDDAVAAFERCIRAGGVAVFPADTVYGLACDPSARRAVERLYRLKGRSPRRSAAVMFFTLPAAMQALPDLGSRTREALLRMLPGPVTAVLPNPARRFPLACGEDPEVIGLRVPDLSGALAPLAAMPVPVLQSSANRTGGPDVRRLEDLEDPIRRKADVVLDAGVLPGAASTVVDLTGYERGGGFSVLREGALGREEIEKLLG